MNCTSQRPLWLLLRPSNQEKQMQRSTYVINNHHQPPVNANVILRSANRRDSFDKQQHITHDGYSNRKDYIVYRENTARNEHILCNNNNNGNSNEKHHTSTPQPKRRSESFRNRIPSSQNYINELYQPQPPMSTQSNGQTKKRVAHTHTHTRTRTHSNPNSHLDFGLISHNLSRAYQPHRKSLEIESLWSDIEDLVFSDDNMNNNDDDAAYSPHSHSLESFKHDDNEDDGTSLVSNTLTATIHRNNKATTTNHAVPIKGILKSGSQSSYSSSSFTNDLGSDREAQTSNNSQQSSESSTSSLGGQGSKANSSSTTSSSSKKKVHFEERVITKTILPFSAFTYNFNGGVYEETPEVLTIIDDVTTHLSNSNRNNHTSMGMSRKGDPNCIHSNESTNNFHQDKIKMHDFYYGNYPASASPSETRNDILENEFHDGTNFDKIKNYFKREKCESEMTFPINDVYLDEAFQSGDNSFYSPTSTPLPTHFMCRHKTGDSKSKSKPTNSDVINDNYKIISEEEEERFIKNHEQKTAFPHRPSVTVSTSSSSDTYFNTTGGEIHRHGWLKNRVIKEHDERDYSSNSSQYWASSGSDRRQPIDYPRTKFLQGRNLSPEEKTLRILDWLDGLKTYGRSGHSSHSHSHCTNSSGSGTSGSGGSGGGGRVSVLVIPRPTLRRHSFVGD